MKSLHQLLDGAARGDAITDQALLMRRWLREAGLQSDVFAAHVGEGMERDVRPLWSFPKSHAPAIYHHSIGSSVAQFLLSRKLPLVMAYHNVTPVEFFVGLSPDMAARMAEGRAQLDALREQVLLALAVSAFNERELRQAGYANTAVLPIALDEANYTQPPSAQVLRALAEGEPPLLFVGRIAPNKRQDDCVKLLHFYRRIRPGARLVLVGREFSPEYAAFLRRMAQVLGLADAVTFTGAASQADLLAYYAAAACFVSMSEHEGFGKPLIESMWLGLPVLAFAAAGVPETMGNAGIPFHRKDFEALAELIDMLRMDAGLRQRVILRQREHARHFLASEVKRIFLRHVQQYI